MSQSIEAIIESKSREFEKNFAAGDVAALVSGYYDENPMVIGQGVGTFNGKEGASQYFTGATQAMSKAILTTRSIEKGEDTVVETGGVKLTPREEGAGEIDLSYVVVWRKGESGWKVHMDYFIPGVLA